MTTSAAPAHKKQRFNDTKASWSGIYDESFGIQSLPVATLPDDFCGDPLDGEQYLAVVRREAAATPGVFFAEHNPYATPALILDEQEPESSTKATCSTMEESSKTDEEQLYMPSLEWKKAFETQFRNAREALSNPPTEDVKLTKDDLPKIGNHTAWYAWIHGRPPPSEEMAGKTHEWRTKEPSGALLLRLSAEQILGLLEAFPYWLAHRVPIPVSQGGDSGNVIQGLHARWIFSLLLRLDGRLVSEEISVLRTLARACVAAITLARIRRKAVQSRTQAERAQNGEAQAEATWRRDEAGAWMVVAIVAGIWGQQDLWEDAKLDMRRVA